MQSEFQVSVVICTRNCAEPLREALVHYQSWLTSAPFELVILDNGSTDHTQRVIQSVQATGLPVRATICEKPGLGRAREHGRQVATSDYLIFTDSDCYPEPGCIESFCKVFAENLHSGFLEGRILRWDESDASVTIDYRTDPVAYPPHTLPYPGDLQGANVAIRRDVLNAIGGFDANLGAGTHCPCDDIDLIERALMQGYAGLFQPATVIFHHHRHKKKHIPPLRLSYAKVRDACCMRLIMDPQTRGIAARNWYWKLRTATRDATHLRKAELLCKPWVDVKRALRYLLSGTYPHRPRPTLAAKLAHLQSPP